MALLPSTLGEAHLTASTQSATIPADLAHLTHDPNLVTKIQRKRQAELERRAKLMDPRTRQYGIEHAHLDAQVAEKRIQKDHADAVENFHSTAALMQDQVTQACEDAKQRLARERHMAAVDYSLTNLRKEHRREWALSDPLALKSELPARVGFDDPRLGISSIQQFEGEDPNFTETKRRTHAATREWLQQQMAEKQARQEAERQLDAQYDQAVMTSNEVRAICENTLLDEMRADKVEEAQDNLNMAEAHAARRQAQKNRDNMESKKHADGVMQSERMKESYDCLRGVDGRIMRAEYKRLSLEEEEDVINTNKYIVLEKKFRQQQAKEEEMEEARKTNIAVGVLGGVETHKNNYLMKKRMEMVEHNKAMAEAKRQMDQMDREKYKSFDLIA